MALCCPPGHGCNAPGGGEPCALALCRAAAEREDDAALAVERWGEFEAATEQRCPEGERRFRRRAFQRARDRALITLAMTCTPRHPGTASVLRARPHARRRARHA